jgi:hypothetical protein
MSSNCSYIYLEECLSVIAVCLHGYKVQCNRSFLVVATKVLVDLQLKFFSSCN